MMPSCFRYMRFGDLTQRESTDACEHRQRPAAVCPWAAGRLSLQTAMPERCVNRPAKFRDYSQGSQEQLRLTAISVRRQLTGRIRSIRLAAFGIRRIAALQSPISIPPCLSHPPLPRTLRRPVFSRQDRIVHRKSATQTPDEPLMQSSLASTAGTRTARILSITPVKSFFFSSR